MDEPRLAPHLSLSGWGSGSGSDSRAKGAAPALGGKIDPLSAEGRN